MSTATMASTTRATLENGSGTPAYVISQFSNHQINPATMTQMTRFTKTFPADRREQLHGGNVGQPGELIKAMSDCLVILQGDCLAQLRTIPDESVNCCITSPPYWGLRDYGVAGQIGLEPTPQEYVEKLVAVFREVRRVLRGDGTCWVNLGDSYFGGGRGGNPEESEYRKQATNAGSLVAPTKVPVGCKPKDLVGIPWRVAFALQADGWWLRQDIIWAKPNPMPESVTDRCTKAHEYIFLLSKSERYWYDIDAVREPHATEEHVPGNKFHPDKVSGPNDRNGHSQWESDPERTWFNAKGRNRRSVWTVATSPYSDAHFATFPPDLIRPCVLAGCPVGGTVLDPFGGSGTTGQVALEYGRRAILIELNPEYVKLIQKRTFVTPGLPLS